MNVYLVTDLLHGKKYVGAEKRNNSEYCGSGRLIIEAIEKFGKWNFKKEIIIDDKYIDNWEECLKLESACILSFNTLRPNGYNISLWNWPLSFEILHRSGKKTKRLKVGIFAPGAQSKGGKITGRMVKEKRIGIFAPGVQSKAGKIGGKIAGKKNKELGRGWFAPGMQSEGGKIGGKINVEKKKGIFDPANKERVRKGRKKGGRMSGRKNLKEQEKKR